MEAKLIKFKLKTSKYIQKTFRKSLSEVSVLRHFPVVARSVERSYF